jgi:hypothetical protein
MVRCEELQELWQNQPQPEPRAVPSESRGMAAALQRFRRRQYAINGVKMVLIVWAAWFCLSRPGVSVLTVLGQLLFLAGLISATVTDWRIQAAIARLDFTRPSAAFLDATLDRRTGWLCIALVSAGMNLMFAGAPAAEILPYRIAFHTAVTLFPFAAFALGLKVRAKRYAMEYKPLVERLVMIRAALEEHAS